MAVDGAVCPVLAQGRNGYDACVPQAIRVDVNPLVDPPAGSAASAIIGSRSCTPTRCAAPPQTHEVILLGQTLPGQIVKRPDLGAGGGCLHHGPDRPSDGWTVGVGVVHPAGRQALIGQPFTVSVSARPFWSSSTGKQTVTLG